MIIINSCRVKYKSYIPIILLIISIVVFLIAASPGYLDIYYKEVTFRKDNGLLNGVFDKFESLMSLSDYRKLVKVTASSTFEGRGDPHVLVTHSSNSTSINDQWVSNPVKNSYFIITFLHHYFKLDSYSFKSRTSYHANIPAQWVVEGSNDMENWEHIHTHESNNDLYELGSECNWDSQNSNIFKSFKVTQTGPNIKTEYNENYFCLGKVEFFGDLIPKSYKCSCFRKERLYLFSFILLIN